MNTNRDMKLKQAASLLYNHEYDKWDWDVGTHEEFMDYWNNCYTKQLVDELHKIAEEMF